LRLAPLVCTAGTRGRALVRGCVRALGDDGTGAGAWGSFVSHCARQCGLVLGPRLGTDTLVRRS